VNVKRRRRAYGEKLAKRADARCRERGCSSRELEKRRLRKFKQETRKGMANKKRASRTPEKESRCLHERVGRKPLRQEEDAFNCTGKGD